MVIAIDGPASSGKGTAAQLLAKKLSFKHIDSGALYRIVAFHVFNMQIDPQDQAKITRLLPDIDVKIIFNPNDKDKIFSRGRDVTDEIRYHIVSGIASQVSKIPKVRTWVNDLVRKLAKDNDVVVEGRDITTRVFPDAELKFYLDASLKERVKRRHLQLQQKGKDTIKVAQVKADMEKRDQNDKNKPGGELVKAEDAIYIDSTKLSPGEVVSFMASKVYEQGHTKRPQVS